MDNSKHETTRTRALALDPLDVPVDKIDHVVHRARNVILLSNFFPLLKDFLDGLSASARARATNALTAPPVPEVIIAPPFTALHAVAKLLAGFEFRPPLQFRQQRVIGHDKPARKSPTLTRRP